MADAIKSVVVDIETKISGNGVDQLNRGLRTADNLSEQLEKQINDIGNAIQRTSQKRLGTAGGEQTKKVLSDIQAELIKAAKNYDQLSDMQKQAVQSMLAENEKLLSSLEDQTKTQEQVQQGVDKYIGAVNILTPLLGQHGVALSLVVSNYLDYTRAAKDGTASSTQLGGAISLLRNKYVALAAAAAGIVAIGLNDYFRNTQDGADQLDKALKGIEFSLRGLVTSATRLITGDFSGALESLKDVFSGRAFERGAEVSAALDQLFDTIQRIRIENAQYNLEIAESREIITEQAQSLDDILKKRQALARIAETETKILANNQRIAEQEYQILLRSASARFGIDEARLRSETEAGIFTTVNDEEAKKLVDAFIRITEAQTEFQNNQRRLNKLQKAVNNESKVLQKEFSDITQGFVQTAKDLEVADPFNLSKLVNENDRIQAQDRLNKAFTGITDNFKRLSEILGVADILELTPAQIAALERKYQLVGGSIFNAILQGIRVQGDITDSIFQINEPRLAQTVEKLVPQVKKTVTDITKQIQDAVNVTNNAPTQDRASLFQRIFSVTPEEREEIRQLFAQAQQDIINAANQFYETEIAKTDFLIQEQQRRIDGVNKLAELGNAEQLQLEQNRLNDLLEERRNFERQQAQINAAAAISATALSAANFAASLTKESLSKTPLVAIASGVALLATIAAGIAQINALTQGFEKGTDYLTPGKKSNRGKTDTIPAWLAPGERVVPASINESLKGIKNADLPKLVAAGKMALEGYGQFNTNITSSSYGFTSEAVGLLKDLKTGISEIPKALSDQIVDIQFDHYGYVIQQRRVARHSEKVKALTR